MHNRNNLFKAETLHISKNVTTESCGEKKTQNGLIMGYMIETAWLYRHSFYANEMDSDNEKHAIMGNRDNAK